MAFQPGHKFSRKKGSRNRRTKEYLEILAQHDWNSASALIYIYDQALERYQDYVKRFKDNRTSPMEDNSASFLKIALGAAQDLASYEYPKQKAIEKNVTVSIEGDINRKLEERKQELQKMLEDQSNIIDVTIGKNE